MTGGGVSVEVRLSTSIEEIRAMDDAQVAAFMAGIAAVLAAQEQP